MFEPWTLKRETVKAEDEALRESIRTLSDSQRAEFYRRYGKRLRDPDTYAVLNWFFLAGLHHYYLGQYWRGTVNLVLMVAGVFLLFAEPLVGVLLVLGVAFVELPALFRSQVIVEHYNTQLGRRLLQLQSRRPSGSSRP